MDSRKKLFLILSVVGPMISSVASVRPALLLTPYIEENRLEEARNQSFVDPKFFLNVNSYSGFFTVDKKYNSNVFFWYFPVANKVVEDTPWIIWLQGGPGGTSLVGLFDEMGPFEYVNGSLKFRDTSWWNEYSMLFIDNPVGAGFSFTNHLDGLPRNMETYGNHLFSTVQQFLTIFPELRQAPLYVAGSSYAGRYVPALATKIHEADKNHLKLCCHQALSTEHYSLPELPPGEAPEPILTFMERTYTSGRARSGYDGGEPLLLSPFIEGNKLEHARKAAYVDPSNFLPHIESYSGYLTVNKEYNANLWFWYFPVMGQSVEKTPWIIWLQGGPGASSLYGLFTEIGPFAVTEENTIEEIKYSWGKNHSLLFIDNPVGTGFSFTDDDRGFATNQTTIGENLYAALQQFLTIFPELRKAPLTIAGESYAGKHIPSLGVQILWHRQEDEPINLYGLAIGNGFIDPLTLQRYSYAVREIGLVDDKVAYAMNQIETAVTQFINNGQMLKAYAYYNLLLQMFLTESHMQNLYNYLQDEINIDGAYLNYIQTNDVRRALHVGNTNFTSIGVVYRKLVPDFMGSAKQMLEELLENYKVMLYNGHLDIIVAYHPSVNTYDSLSFSGSTQYKKAKRQPWYHDGRLAGYYKTAGNLVEVMIRGAGHMAPADQPAASLGLITAFTRGQSLADDTGALVHAEKNSLRQQPQHTQT